MGSLGISIDYAQVNLQAGKVRKCAQSLEDVKNQLDRLTGEIGQGWKGDAAAEFLEKCEMLSGRIDKLAAEVNTTSDSIVRAIRLYMEAEERAKQLAKSSGGGGGGGGGGAW